MDKYYKLKHLIHLTPKLTVKIVLILNKRKRVGYHLSKSNQLRSRQNHAVQCILDLVIS